MFDIADAIPVINVKSVKHSTPSRIAEALAPLTFIAETCKRVNGPDAVDVVPTLFLAVSLSRIDGEEERALQTFKQAFLKIRPDIPPLNIIWARANKARLLRQLNRIPEAELEEKFTRCIFLFWVYPLRSNYALLYIIRHWILRNRTHLRPAVIKAGLSDDVNTGAYILDHPEIVACFNQIEVHAHLEPATFTSILQEEMASVST